MLEVFNEGEVLHAETDAPGTSHAVAEGAFTGDVGVAVEGKVGKVVIGHAGGQGRQALGAVAKVVVVTGSVPADDAGGAPVKLVLNEQGSHPASAVQTGFVVAHAASGEVESHTEGIPVGDVAGHASPPSGAVFAELDVMDGPAIGANDTEGRKHALTELADAGSPDIRIAAGEVVFTHAVSVRADTGEHAPGSDLHAIEGQRNEEAAEVDVVHVGLVVALIAVLVVAGEVVVVRTGPESGGADVLVELVGQSDTGHIIAEGLGALQHKGRSLDALDTHTDLKVGVRNHPVDVGTLHFDRHAVSAHGAAGTLAFSALASAAPGGVADFKVHGAGESFRSDSVQLQADTLTGFKFVFLIVVAGLAVAAGEVAVLTIIKAHDPLALRLEIDSVGAGRHTKHETSRDKECGEFLHDKPSFLSDCTLRCGFVFGS